MSEQALVATVELNLSLARPVIAVLRVARHLIGEARAVRAAEWAVFRLIRWRVPGLCGWQWLGPIERS